MQLDKKDLKQCKSELETLIDTKKQQQTTHIQHVVCYTREQYELWWAELEEVKELLRQT